MISATVIADSINQHGCRLTTYEAVVPKQILAQINTHGMERRVAESSRAKPIRLMLRQVQDHPYLPPQWNYRQTGMQPGGPMSLEDANIASEIEMEMRQAVLNGVTRLEALGCAKEDANRYLEPWLYVSMVITGTEWDNYFQLRNHGDPQAAHSELARKMLDARDASTPILRPFIGHESIDHRQWHLPYVTDEERETLEPTMLPMLASARCGRVSYGNQGVIRPLNDDIDWYHGAVEQRHLSPLEFAARSMPDARWYGPLQGWASIRKHYKGESGSTQHGTQEDLLPWAIRRLA